MFKKHIKNILESELDNKAVHLLLPMIKTEIQATIHVAFSLLHKGLVTVLLQVVSVLQQDYISFNVALTWSAGKTLTLRLFKVDIGNLVQSTTKQWKHEMKKSKIKNTRIIHD